jgi:hypothetical protein
MYVPDSDELEGFHEKVRDLDDQLAKLGSAEVTRSEVISELSNISKQWLKMSTALAGTGICDLDILQKIDNTARDILQSTTTRGRASAYRKRLSPLRESFIPSIIIPVIKYEGNPIQVAARQVREIFSTHMLADEEAYLDEASRCVTVRCYRAAIIMLWAAAISRFHRAIENLGFSAYNVAYATTIAKTGNPFNRVSKGATISSLPELQKIRDFDIIVVGMELWKYDLQTYEELDRLLGIRNTAAHPGMVIPTIMDVQQFASKVDTLVFSLVKVWTHSVNMRVNPF